MALSWNSGADHGRPCTSLALNVSFIFWAACEAMGTPDGDIDGDILPTMVHVYHPLGIFEDASARGRWTVSWSIDHDQAPRTLATMCHEDDDDELK